MLNECEFAVCNRILAARKTWKELSKFTNIPVRTLQKRKQELVDAGVIFFRKRSAYSSNHKKTTLLFFPLVVQAWFVKKASKGELF